MAVTGSPASSPSPLPDVPWDDVVRFVRQLNHDLRNHLNAIDLQAVFIADIATDPELKDEIKRLRGLLSDMTAVLQKLSANVIPPGVNLMSCKARDFLDDLRKKMESTASEQIPPITWDVQVGDATVDLDPQLLALAIEELLANAARFGNGNPVTLSARVDETKGLVLTLTEAKEHFEAATENWGRQPLRSVKQGHYGLGLNRARTIVESHGGRLAARYDQAAKTLVTTITLPATAAAG